jgi:hypothetical protein
MRTITRLFSRRVVAACTRDGAVLNSDNELVGTWAQGPVTLPLTFTRGTK